MIGSKKPKTEKKPYLINVLTPHRVIEGYTSPNYDLFSDSATGNYGFAMKDARISPLGAEISSPIFFSRLIIPDTSNILAILAMDDAAKQSCEDAFESYAYGFVATVHCGPFTIKGDMFFLDEDPEEELTGSGDFMPMKNAYITCHIPNSPVDKMLAPMLIANLYLMICNIGA